MTPHHNDVKTTTAKRVKNSTYRVVSVLVVVVAIFSVLGDIMRVITILTGRSLLSFAGSDGRIPLRQLPQLLHADLRPGTSATLADADLSLRLLCASPCAVQAVTIVLAVAFLLRMLRGVAAAEPFSVRVLSGWRILTLALLLGGIIQGLADTIAGVYLASRIGLLFGAGHVTSEQADSFLGGDYQVIGTNVPQWPVAVIVAGLVALALTAAFRDGARLEREVDGVV